jgi:hypothetical protein
MSTFQTSWEIFSSASSRHPGNLFCCLSNHIHVILYKLLNKLQAGGKNRENSLKIKPRKIAWTSLGLNPDLHHTSQVLNQLHHQVNLRSDASLFRLMVSFPLVHLMKSREFC